MTVFTMIESGGPRVQVHRVQFLDTDVRSAPAYSFIDQLTSDQLSSRRRIDIIQNVTSHSLHTESVLISLFLRLLNFCDWGLKYEFHEPQVDFNHF